MTREDGRMDEETCTPACNPPAVHHGHANRDDSIRERAIAWTESWLGYDRSMFGPSAYELNEWDLVDSIEKLLRETR